MGRRSRTRTLRPSITTCWSRDFSSDSEPDAPGSEPKMKQVVRFAGVHASEDHKSETQFKGFLGALQHFVEVINSSPLAREEDLDLQISELAAKLLGMHSDHAEDQKKLARLISQWKLSISRDSLGHSALRKLSKVDLLKLLDAAQKEKITELGGEAIWDTFTAVEQARLSDEGHFRGCA